MKQIFFTLKWLLRAWPVIIPIIVILLHVTVLCYFQDKESEINKVLSLSLQVVGGMFVLYSIDSTIGIIKGQSLLTIVKNWMRSFPFIKKTTVVAVSASSHSMFRGKVKLRGLKAANTVEEKIDYLQQQITWLKEDLNEEIVVLNSKFCNAEKRLGSSIQDTNKQLSDFQTQVENVSIGGIGMQFMGVVFMVHGAIAGYIA